MISGPLNGTIADELLLMMLMYLGIAFLGILLVNWSFRKIIPYLKKRSADAAAARGPRPSTEVLHYAKSVNSTLSCLERDLISAASSSNVHACER